MESLIGLCGNDGFPGIYAISGISGAVPRGPLSHTKPARLVNIKAARSARGFSRAIMDVVATNHLLAEGRNL